MARIRSVHPGLFTDEAFMALSDAARVFLIGLWTEADDHGVFEWKPLTLKARLRPNNNEPVDALLGEMEAVDVIRRFDVDGRAFGALRNFTVYQRPKSPQYKHILPADLFCFVGLKKGDDGQSDVMAFPRDTTAAERQRAKRERDKGGTCHASAVTSTEPIPQNSELSRQMEDGGGNRREEERKIGGAEAPAMAFVGKVIRLSFEDFDRWRTAYGAVPDLRAELEAADAHYADNPPKNGKWFFPASNWLKRAHEQALAKEREERASARSWN
jgi:hypothetical protein